MKIDFNQLLHGPDGKVITVPDPEDATRSLKLTLKLACTEALCAAYRGEENLSGQEKYNRSTLARQINAKNQPVVLTSSEVVMLKECLGKRWMALVIGPAWDAIEPPEKVSELDKAREKKGK